MKFEEIDSQQNLAYLLRTFNGMPLKRLLETRDNGKTVGKFDMTDTP